MDDRHFGYKRKFIKKNSRTNQFLCKEFTCQKSKWSNAPTNYRADPRIRGGRKPKEVLVRLGGAGETMLISVLLLLLLLRGTRSESVWILLANSQALALALSSGIWSWFQKRNGNSKENGEFSSSDQVQEVMLLLERNPYDQFVCNFSLALCTE